MDFKEQLVDYLKEVLGLKKAPILSFTGKNLPVFITRTYKLYTVKVAGQKYLLMFYPGDTEQPPATVKKHLGKAQELTGMNTVYAGIRISPHNRKRLIGFGIVDSDCRHHRKISNTFFPFDVLAISVFQYFIKKLDVFRIDNLFSKCAFTLIYFIYKCMFTIPKDYL